MLLLIMQIVSTTIQRIKVTVRIEITNVVNTLEFLLKSTFFIPRPNQPIIGSEWIFEDNRIRFARFAKTRPIYSIKKGLLNNGQRFIDIITMRISDEHRE